jgi:hypothetical protein
MNQSNDFTKQLIDSFLNSLQEGTIWALKFVWDLITSFLLQNWVAVVIILVIVLIYAVLKALTGHWWVLGHVLYNYFYWGLILAIGAIWGPESFAGIYAEIGLFALYIVCYILVGKILRKFRY